jgi:hypothetical protein
VSADLDGRGQDRVRFRQALQYGEPCCGCAAASAATHAADVQLAKRRGFCPSCGARRMSQTAAHLVDHVIPRVPVRQWVLSLTIPLRLLPASQPELVTPVPGVVRRVLELG